MCSSANGEGNSPSRPPTLDEGLQGSRNALNFIRLILASAVIVGHAWGLHAVPGSPPFDVAGWAVNGFFIISGYLITGSRLRLPLVPYLWRRVLRIMPAFWACLIITAFIFAPLASWIAGARFRPDSALSYVTGNALLFIRQWEVLDSLQTVPFSGVWNGSLWTLWYEFGAYIVTGLMLGIAWIRRHLFVVSVALVGVLMVLGTLAAGPLDVTYTLYVQVMRLGGYFLAGMALYAARHRLRLSPLLAALSVAVLVVLALAGVADLLGQLPVAYLLLWLGAKLPVRLGARNDISYGIYIYAFPMQQFAALSGIGLGNLVVAIALPLLMTVPWAAASWWFLEKPVMRFKGLLDRKRRAEPGGRGSVG